MKKHSKVHHSMLREETDSPCEDIEDDWFRCDNNSDNNEYKYKPEEKSDS